MPTYDATDGRVPKPWVDFVHEQKLILNLLINLPDLWYNKIRKNISISTEAASHKHDVDLRRMNTHIAKATLGETKMAQTKLTFDQWKNLVDWAYRDVYDNGTRPDTAARRSATRCEGVLTR